MSHITDSRSYRDTVESGWFVPDCWRGVPLRFSVDPSFLEEMERIDPRLVLRRPPWSDAVLAYIRFPDGRLWCQPVHEFRNPVTGQPWKPQSRDLQKLKRASYESRQVGWKDMMHRAWQKERMQEEASKERREDLIREQVGRYLRKNDISARKLGAARGPMGS